MLTTLKSIASLLLSFGLLLMANGLFATLLGVRSSLEGFSTFVVGLIMWGRFAVRVVASVGHIRAFAAFASIMSTTALIHVLWIDPVVWFVLRLTGGFCMAGMIMVSESWINECASNEMRGQVLSFYMITNYFAAGCGQFLLPLADPSEFHLFSVASIIFSLALVPVLLSRAQAPMPAGSHSIKMKALYRISPLGFIGVFCAGLVNASFHGMGAVFGHAIGLSTQQISIFMASAIFGGLVLQWPMGRLSDRVDRRWVLTGVSLITCVACLAIMLFAGERNTVVLYTAAGVYGSVSFTVYSLAAAHINDFAERDQLVQIASGLLNHVRNWRQRGPHRGFCFHGSAGTPQLVPVQHHYLGWAGDVRLTPNAPPSQQEQGGARTVRGGAFGFLGGFVHRSQRPDRPRSSGGITIEMKRVFSWVK